MVEERPPGVSSIVWEEYQRKVAETPPEEAPPPPPEPVEEVEEVEAPPPPPPPPPEVAPPEVVERVEVMREAYPPPPVPEEEKVPPPPVPPPPEPPPPPPPPEPVVLPPELAHLDYVERAKARAEIVAEAIKEGREPPSPPEPVPPPELTADDYKAYEALTGEEKFEQQVVWGTIPEGSIYLSETDYLSASAVETVRTTDPELHRILIDEGPGAYLAELERRKIEYDEWQRKIESGEVVRLYGETYMTREELEKIKTETPELFAILSDPARGYDAYVAEIARLNAEATAITAKFEAEVYPTLPPDLQLSYTKGKEADDFTAYNQNVVAYNLAVQKLQERVDKAKEIMDAEFKSRRVDEPDAYNVKRALMTRRPEVVAAVELLFDEGVVDALYGRYPFLKPGYVPPPKREWAPGVKPKEKLKYFDLKVSPELASILGVAVPVAVGEPTFIGELLVLAAVGGYLAYQELKRKEGVAVLPEIARTAEEFKSKEGREITADDITRTLVRDTAEMSMAVIKPLPTLLPGTKALELPPLPSYAVTPLMPGYFPGTAPIEVPSIPGLEIIEPPPPLPPFEGKMEFDNVMVASAEVAEADDEITTIIRPKVMTPSELEAVWNVPLDKKAQALVALDAAVQDAYTTGEIDAEGLRVYQTARDNYLTKRGALDSAVKTASDMLGLPRAETEGEKKLAQDVVIAHNAAMKAQREWLEYQARTLAEPTPVTAEQMELQRIRTQEGMRLAAEAAERAREFEDVLKVYYNAVGETQEAYLTKVAEYQLKLPSDVNALIAAATQLALQNIQEQANQAATQAYTQALAQGMTQTQAQQAAQTAAQNAIQSVSQTATQQAVKTATQTATKTATKAAVKTLTSTATQTATQTAVLTAVNTALAVMTQTAVVTATAAPILPIILPRLEEISPISQPIEMGSICWRQGMYWKFIPPPYDMDKPITLKRGVIPLGAVNTELLTPQETIQMIGRSRTAVVPESISIDLGVVDAFITKRGTQIEFRGKGILTDVGERIPLTTQGMSVDEGVSRYLFDVEGYPDELAGQGVSRTRISKKKPSGKGISRSSFKKKKPKRKGKGLTDYDYMTTLKGFRP